MGELEPILGSALFRNLMEWTSVIGNVVFTILLGRGVRVGWLFGFAASLLGVWLYGTENAWLMAALNAFYAAMGVYGWLHWGRPEVTKRISTLNWKQHLTTIVIGAGLTFALVALMRAVELEGEYQWMEAFIAAFAIVATWLMSRKVLENWIYWTVGDIVGVLYNHWVGFDGYAILMVLYIVLAIIGFARWQKEMKASAAAL